MKKVLLLVLPFLALAAGVFWRSSKMAQAQSVPIATCDGVFHWVGIQGTTCGNGQPYGYEYVCFPGNGISGKMIFYLEGGGLCFDADTCDCQPAPDGTCTNPFSSISNSGTTVANSNNGQPWSNTYWGTDAKAFNGPTSAFATQTGPSWNLIHFFYCTGDSHSGNSVQTFTTTARSSIACAVNADCPQATPNVPASTCVAGFCTEVSYPWSFKGWTSDSAILDDVKQRFPTPVQATVWGESSGGQGVDCELAKFRGRWPGIPMYSMNNAGNPLSAGFCGTTPILQTWGVFHPDGSGHPVSDTCPLLTAPDQTLVSMADEVRYNDFFISDVRRAYSEDTCDAVINAFAEIIGCPPDPFVPPPILSMKAPGAKTAALAVPIRKPLGTSKTLVRFKKSFKKGHGLVTPFRAQAKPGRFTTAAGPTFCDAVTGAMVQEFNSDIQPPTNRTPSQVQYHVFYHTGDCHTERENQTVEPGCSYDDMVTGSVKFNDWVRGLMQIQGNPAFVWGDVRP